jgi:ABC-type transport system involved in cytochrome c biogenesis ATPase subunit
MLMLSRIQALHYRCFRDLDVSLPKYCVLAGGNGSGKTTLMDIPLLFSDMLSSTSLVQAFLEPLPLTNVARTQRLQELIHCYKGDHFGFALEAPLPQHVLTTLDASTLKRPFHTLRYEIRFQIFNQVELYVTDEFLWLLPETKTPHTMKHQLGGSAPKSWRPIITREAGQLIKIRPETKGSAPSLHLRPNELALKNLPLDEALFPASVWFIRMLQVGTILYEPDVIKLQQDARLISKKTIHPDASNLPWMVLSLQQDDPKGFDLWVKHVRVALPHLKHIEAIRRQDEFHAYLQVTYDGDYTVPSSGLSAGTLRILALTILPYLSNPPDIICLEEPENGVHPRAIEAILDSLNSLYDSQVLLSTHSPIVLASTALQSVIVLQSDETGEKKAIAGDKHPLLEDWHGEIDLGSLFAAGILDT